MAFPICERLTESLSVLGTTVSASVTTALTGGVTDLSKVRKVAFVVAAGTLAASETITAKVQGCATSGGSYVDIPSSSFTLVKATDDNKSLVIETTAESINSLGLGYRFVRYSVAGAVGSPIAVVAIGAAGPEHPMSAVNAASVKSLNVV